MVAYLNSSKTTKAPSPISKIYGKDVVTWLKDRARDFPGTQYNDADSEWNGMMADEARVVGGGGPGSLAAPRIFPGLKSLDGTFENGTTFSWDFVASVLANFSSVTSGEDFYHQIVAPTTVSPPASTPPPEATPSTAPHREAPYPDDPAVVQVGLLNNEQSWITGYLLKEASIGVLSIPGFDSTSENANHFSEAVGEFIDKSKAAGMKKIVIDLQGNGGGSALLAYDTFARFFPTTTPFGGVRMRATDLLNKVGEFISDAKIPTTLSATYLLDADGVPFKSWNESYGPDQIHGDKFTHIVSFATLESSPRLMVIQQRRYNLSNAVFDETTLGAIVYGYGNLSTNIPDPYAAEDILMVSCQQHNY
jgi:hypothetical protein